MRVDKLYRVARDILRLLGCNSILSKKSVTYCYQKIAANILQIIYIIKFIGRLHLFIFCCVV